MGDQVVLTSEEVDAILKISQDQGVDTGGLSGNFESSHLINKYSYALGNISDVIKTDCEKSLSALIRKKLLVKIKSASLMPLSECLNANGVKSVISLFRTAPKEHSGLVLINMPFIHQSINLIFGGRLNLTEPVIENPGKVGIIIAEKIAQLMLTAFTQACGEYGENTCEIIKVAPAVDMLANPSLDVDEQVYCIVLNIYLDNFETSLTFVIAEQFLSEFIPPKAPNKKHRDKDFWRTAIKTQVVDSYVTINVALPEVTMKVKEFMELKVGDIIPISDPTAGYVCLNNLKLFKATAGQANGKMVVKIVYQI